MAAILLPLVILICLVVGGYFLYKQRGRALAGSLCSKKPEDAGASKKCENVFYPSSSMRKRATASAASEGDDLATARSSTTDMRTARSAKGSDYLDPNVTPAAGAVLSESAVPGGVDPAARPFDAVVGGVDPLVSTSMKKGETAPTPAPADSASPAKTSSTDSVETATSTGRKQDKKKKKKTGTGKYKGKTISSTKSSKKNKKKMAA